MNISEKLVEIAEKSQAIYNREVAIVERTITEYSIPHGTTTIGSYAFNNWHSIIRLTIPNSVKTIQQYGVSNCISLTSVIIPNSVINIYYNAFLGCKNLASVTFEGKPTVISTTSFASTANLTDIYVPWAEGEVANAPWGATNATIHYNYGKYTEGLEYILSTDGTYYICDGGNIAGDISIPPEYNGLPVKEIYSSAFYGDRRGYRLLTSVVIPDTIETIWDGAFEAQWNLASIILKGVPLSIDYNAFATDSLASVRGEEAVPCDIYVPWAEGTVSGAPWGAVSATIHYNSEV